MVRTPYSVFWALVAVLFSMPISAFPGPLYVQWIPATTYTDDTPLGDKYAGVRIEYGTCAADSRTIAVQLGAIVVPPPDTAVHIPVAPGRYCIQAFTLTSDETNNVSDPAWPDQPVVKDEPTEDERPVRGTLAGAE